MNPELEKALRQSLDDDTGKAIVRQINDLVETWELVLPDVPPLVFDFGRGDVLRIGETEYWIANEMEQGYCGKFLFLLQGQTCPEHSHKLKHETFFLVKGRLTMTCDGKIRSLAPGGILPVEPGVAHSFTAEEHSLVLEISKPSLIDDNYFTDADTGYNR